MTRQLLLHVGLLILTAPVTAAQFALEIGDADFDTSPAVYAVSGGDWGRSLACPPRNTLPCPPRCRPYGMRYYQATPQAVPDPLSTPAGKAEDLDAPPYFDGTELQILQDLRAMEPATVAGESEFYSGAADRLRRLRQQIRDQSESGSVAVPTPGTPLTAQSTGSTTDPPVPADQNNETTETTPPTDEPSNPEVPDASVPADETTTLPDISVDQDPDVSNSEEDGTAEVGTDTEGIPGDGAGTESTVATPTDAELSVPDLIRQWESEQPKNDEPITEGYPEQPIVDGPIDRLGLADSLYAAGQIPMALEMYDRLKPSDLSEAEKHWVLFQQAGCYRRLGEELRPGAIDSEQVRVLAEEKFSEARKYYRRVGSLPDAGLLQQMALWWVQRMDNRDEMTIELGQRQQELDTIAQAVGIPSDESSAADVP